MVYKYEKEIVNTKNIDHFYDKNNFVGYILPNGDIYQCIEHNVSNVDTVLRMYLQILKDHYGDKEVLLKKDTTDKLLKLVINYLKNATYFEIVALSKFINEHNLFVSDVIVQLLGCHLVTRLDKTIVTSEINHKCFFNYLLNNFTVRTIDKMVYDPDLHEYKYVTGLDRNEYLYDEVEKIKKEVKEEERELFYRTK